MAGTLHIYRGLQGSGKSTLAEANASVDGGRLVGRDRIRKLIGAHGLGSKAQEHEVTELQGRLICKGLKAEQHVHVDDMNLKAVYVRRLLALAEKFKAKVEVHDLTNVSPVVCITRDAQRSSKVGHDLIRNNFNRFIKGQPYPLPMPTEPMADMRMMPAEPYVADQDKPKAILVDLDGTVALKGDRGYNDYDERVFYDLPNKPVIGILRAVISAGITPIYLSGRKGYEDCRTATYAWISKHVHASALWLFMREPHDNRPDWIVKTELFDTQVRNTWNVLAALDDRDQVVQRYREMGLTVLQVADGNF